MKPVDVWIVLEDGPERLFSQKMNLCTGHLFFQAADHRRGEDNIADGRKPDDQEFHIEIAAILIGSLGQQVICFNIIQILVKCFLGEISGDKRYRHHYHSRNDATFYDLPAPCFLKKVKEHEIN